MHVEQGKVTKEVNCPSLSTLFKTCISQSLYFSKNMEQQKPALCRLETERLDLSPVQKVLNEMINGCLNVSNFGQE